MRYCDVILNQPANHKSTLVRGEIKLGRRIFRNDHVDRITQAHMMKSENNFREKNLGNQDVFSRV